MKALILVLFTTLFSCQPRDKNLYFNNPELYALESELHLLKQNIPDTVACPEIQELELEIAKLRAKNPKEFHK